MEVKSSLDDLKKKLVEEAERKASEIIEEAKREADLIIKRAEEEWREKAENERKNIIEQAKREADRTISEARVKARLIIINAKNTLFNEIFNEVLKIVENRENFDKKTSLERLLNESLVYMSKPVRVIVDSKDREIVGELLRERNLNNIEVIESNDIIGGLILEDSDGRRVDNSYKTRLERARRILGPYITKYLWSTES